MGDETTEGLSSSLDKDSGSGSSQIAKTCNTCSLPVDRHYGPVGKTRCWGASQCGPNSAFATAFAELRELVSSTRAELRAERSEARDREKRLSQRLSELSRQLQSSQATIDHLEDKVRALEERSARGGASGDGVVGVPTCTSRSRGGKKSRKGTARASAASAQRRESSWAERTGALESDAESSGLIGSDENDSHDADQSHQHDQHPQMRSERTQGRTTPHPADKAHASTDENRTAAAANNRTSVRTLSKKRPQPRFDPVQSDDESWQLVSSIKPRPARSVIFVGKLAAETTAEQLVEFVHQRASAVGLSGLKVHNARIFPSKRNGPPICGSRITVDETYADALLDRSFWPWPIRSREWEFRETEAKKNASPTDGPTGTADPNESSAAAATGIGSAPAHVLENE